ncbi:MAG: NAD(P)/FAD-dependent oxidoreductase [Hyphomicrobium sp.]
MKAAIPLADPSGMPDSYWAAAAEAGPAVPDFDGSETAETVVIGAGYTGLSAALHLAERARSVLVLDAHEPGWGASGRNNGQVVAALKHEPHEIEQRFGKERGAALIQAIGRGPDLVLGLIARYGIECAARRSGILTAAHSAASLADLKRRVEIWNARGAPLRLLSRDEMEAASGTGFYPGGCLDPRGGAINPLGYARGLARTLIGLGGAIRQKAEVRSIERAGTKWRVRTARGHVDAEHVIIGTNAYTGAFWPGLKKTFLPSRTPQLVSRPLRDNVAKSILPGGQIMSDTRYLTVGVRMHEDGRLHLGGGNGTAGAETDALYAPLARQAHLLYPQLGELEWQYRWSGFMAMTPDRYPRLFELAPGIAAALGYSGRGICTATILGAELARWAAGEAGIDELAMPASSFRTLPYYALRGILVDSAVRYYSFRDRVSDTGQASA